MSSKKMTTDLFKFVTIRNPQLLTEENKEKGFVYYPSSFKGVFLTAVDGIDDVEDRMVAMETVTTTYTSLGTKAQVKAVKPTLYDFSAWLMRNKKVLTQEEVTAKVVGVNQVVTAEEITLWQELIYQSEEKKSKTVREACVQMIVAQNFLEKWSNYSTVSVEPEDIAQANSDLQRLACAAVVLPKEVVNRLKADAKIGQDIKSTHRKLEREVQIAVAKENITLLETAIAELEVADRTLNKENEADFKTSMATHEAAVATAYSNATANEDANGKITYTNLTLPVFSFTAKDVMDETTLAAEVSDDTMDVLEKVDYASYEDIISVKERLSREMGEQQSIVVQNTRSDMQTIYRNHEVITLHESKAALYCYSIHTLTANNGTKGNMTMTMTVGGEPIEISSSNITIVAGAINNTITNVSLTAQNDGIATIRLTPTPINIPFNGTSAALDGTITLGDGTVLTLSQTIYFDRVANGCATTSNSGEVPNTTAEDALFGIHKIGVADFRKVEQEVCCYMPGEVSHIENILAREYKERETRRLTSSETTVETTEESETENLTDTTTTERNELNTEVSAVVNEDSSNNFGASAGVNGTLGGGVQFYANGFANFASSSSSSNSNFESQNYAQEVTERALERVVQKITKKRTSKILREYEETNTHGFDNREGNDHVTGVYRWVDKIYNNKLVNYGKRLMYEFMVPEPSRFFKEAAFQKAENGALTMESGVVLPSLPPTLESKGLENPWVLGNSNYVTWAANWKAEVEAPSKEYIRLGQSYSGGQFEGSQGSRQFSFNDFEIPEGYEAVRVVWKFDFREAQNNNTSASLIMANKRIPITYNGAVHGGTANPPSGEFPVYNYTQTNFPISVVGWDIGSFALNVTVTCKRTVEASRSWKLNTYNTIKSAYQDRLQEYNDAIAAREAQFAPEQGGRTEFNPGLNRILEKRELKRLGIQMLTAPFNINSHGADNYKNSIDISLDANLDHKASVAKFFEQAFDWEIMAYLFYPYYYAEANGDEENGIEKWIELFQESNGTDPIFQAFLQSSMARMVVPVRPGFEDAVTYYLETGDIWNGEGVALSDDDDLYVSIADEMQTIDGTVEKEWETRVPTALNIVQGDSVFLDEQGLPCSCLPEEENTLKTSTNVLAGQTGTTP